MKIKFLIIFICSISCKNPTSKVSDHWLDANKTNSFLLYGFDTDTKSARSPCISGPNGSYISLKDLKSQSTWRFRTSTKDSWSSTTETNEAQGNAEGAIDLLVFRGETSANLELKLLKTSFERTFAHSIIIARTVSANFDNLFINSTGKALLDNNANDRVQSVCGSEYVSSMEVGLKLDIVATVKFSRKEDIKKLDGKIKLDFIIGKVKGDFSALDSSITERTEIEISAFQSGGDQANLFEILPKKMSCTLDEVESCDAILSRLSKYASDVQTSYKKSANDQPLTLKTRPYNTLPNAYELHSAIYGTKREAPRNYGKFLNILRLEFLRSVKLDLIANEASVNAAVIEKKEKILTLIKEIEGRREELNQLISECSDPEIKRDDQETCVSKIISLQADGKLNSIEEQLWL